MCLHSQVLRDVAHLAERGVWDAQAGRSTRLIPIMPIRTLIDNRLSYLDDDGKLRTRFTNKRINAGKEGISFQLEFSEFLDLLEEARIKSSDLGIKGFHLSRNDDAGPYQIGNCHFRWYVDNLSERKLTEKWRQASAKNAKLGSRKISEMYRTDAQFIEHMKGDKPGRFGPSRKTPKTWDEKETVRKAIEVASTLGIKPGDWGWLAKVAPVLGLAPQTLGRFYQRVDKATPN